MILDVLTHALLAMLAAQTPGSAPATSITVPRWSNYEMNLTATGQYDSAYISVDLVGVFSGPHGEGVVVKGFWDGGQTFRIRFTPTSEGTWTFNTVSDDPGLDGHAGSLTCIKARDGSHGFIRRAVDASRVPIHDDGTAVDGERIPVSMHARVARCGTRVSPCGDASGAGWSPVDLAQLQLADRLVANAFERGRVAEIVLFDSGDSETVDESDAYRYVEYMAARYGAFSNVVWCLSPASASDRRGDFRHTARNLLTTLDPYFMNGARQRVVGGSCAATS